ncbi:molybdate transport system substrate-binding protein [Aeromicrobium panaciterrae]|uniref:Molybdate transport system substrate-binding protein n=1 Tax=Aeromicrobium panaciterrae TaxID=363861 RepID=A0ABU1UQZ7_9ACTN|nr:molybdate ABC transporter substrate-binding protein [Aeromicrobium panaciterrae]MDR7087565.1 molybdate transport system substrate-binding protein [Aeromicrobium panaciterrae]
MNRFVALVASLLLVTAGCGSESADRNGPTKKVTLTVFAAASLKGAFTELGKQFEAEHEGVTVTFNFAGSSDLVAQIQQGAPADVFASADTKNMDVAITANLLEGSARNFATNTLEIATPADNPAEVNSLDDLAKSGVKVVLCAEQVPCGSAAAKVEEASGIDIKPVSEEQSVTDVLGKVISGEADAGLVYVTDVKAAGDKVNGIEFPESGDVVNTYPIAAIKGNVGDGLAEAFISFITGSEGQAVLAAAGFGKP